MTNRCTHDRCDICAGRTCDGTYPDRFGEYLACEMCVGIAIKFAYDAACTFGGTIIDTSKPCGNAPAWKEDI